MPEETSPAEARERIADYLASRERRPLYGDQIASGYDGSQLRLSDLRAAFTAMNAVCEAAERFYEAIGTGPFETGPPLAALSTALARMKG